MSYEILNLSQSLEYIKKLDTSFQNELETLIVRAFYLEKEVTFKFIDDLAKILALKRELKESEALVCALKSSLENANLALRKKGLVK